MKNYIYVLIDPVTNEVVYVGRTKMPERRKTNHTIKNTEFEIIEETTDWVESEKFWISYFKFLGAKLKNVSPGGYDVSKVTKEKQSEKRKGDKHPRYGKPVSLEQRLKQSKSHKGNLAKEKHPFWGKPRSEETKFKIAKKLGSKFSDDQIRSIRNDPRKLTEIAEEYDTVISIISRIKNNKIWRHVL